ncbi:MAG TPA: 2-dehydropantoate 2-reductase [Steroidobacteraceae bacterium]|jgi:2-dehydropantoate 2-reductase
MTSAVIVGAGAIGSWLADALIRADWSVSMVARGETLAALKRAGLTLIDGKDQRTSRPRCGAPSELGAHDYVLLAVKAHELPALAPALLPLIGAGSTVVSATNGIPWWFFEAFGGALGNCELASVDPDGVQARVFGKGAGLGAVVHATARVISAGRVEVKAADRLILGEPDGRMTERLQNLAAAFKAGGIRAVASQHIRAEVWSKLLGNMCINPVSALTRGTTQRLFQSNEVRRVLEDMMQEMQAIGAKLGLDMPMSPAERIEVAERLGDFKTSMLIDVEAGRTLELAPQLGALVEIADALNLDVPKMRTVLALASLLSLHQGTV